MSTKPELIVPKDHISLTSVNDINDICKPLFDNTDIGFLSYARIYTDSSTIMLSNNLQYNEYAFGERADSVFNWDMMHNLVNSNLETLHNNKRIHWLTESVTPDELFDTYVNRFNFVCGMEIVSKNNDYYEVCWFDSNTHKSLTNVYLHGFDLLENFIIYFREKASDLILVSEQQKIIHPEHASEFSSSMQDIITNRSFTNGNIDALKKVLCLKKYPLTYKNITACLSPKEVLCLYYLAKGYSQKEISNMEDVSTRTTESHVQHIRDKMDGYSTKKVLDIFRSSSLASLDPTVFAN